MTPNNNIAKATEMVQKERDKEPNPKVRLALRGVIAVFEAG